MKRSAILLLVLWLGATTAAQAGVVVDIVNQENRGGEKKVTSGRLYLDTGLLKMVSDTGDTSEPEIIYRGDEGRMLIVDHKEKTAMSIDAETMREFVAQMQMMQKQMQDALSQLPAEQRQAAEEMMKQRMPAGMAQMGEPTKVEVVALDGTRKKDGRTCRGWEVRIDGKLQSTIWASEWKDVEIDKEDFKPFMDMAAFFEELLQSMPMMADEGSTELFSGLDEITGFPVVVETHENGEIVEETFFRNARRQDLDDQTFQPPAGYTMQNLKDQMQGR